jgi:two-component system, OmpR family, sensor histidine kinase KdpD
MPRLIRRLAISVCLVAVIFAICLRLPHVDHATVALLLVLATVGLAKMWGRAEALTAAIIGGIAFEYYFPPRGVGIANPQYLVALAAFLITAVATGQLAAHSERCRIEAVTRQDEMEKMYRLVNAMLESGSARSTVAQLADKLVEIFDAGGVALYDKHTGLIVRSGPQANAISDGALREVVTRGERPQKRNSSPEFALVPIRHGDELVGSLGLSGRRLSERLLSGVAGRVGLGLARLYAMETTTEAEVLRRSEELKSAVLDAMAHDIRTPLNSVKLAATTLLSGQAGSESQRQEMLTIIDEEVDRMDRLIDEAVRLARADATELSLNKEPQNIAQLVPAAVAEMGALTRRRPIRMSVPESLPPAQCDKDLITRVLKQLLGNALKYSPDGSPLTVSAEYTGAAIVIDVVDQGPGVDREERDRIFEKYYRGRAARPGTPGTGLGLASARSIVQAHGGEIWVTSPPAGGAAFHVSLPAASGGNGAGAL